MKTVMGSKMASVSWISKIIHVIVLQTYLRQCQAAGQDWLRHTGLLSLTLLVAHDTNSLSRTSGLSVAGEMAKVEASTQIRCLSGLEEMNIIFICLEFM